MTIPPDREAQILRYYHVEKWRINTIAKQLRVHHSTVARVLAQAGLPRMGTPARASAVDAYVAFITQTLARFPTLTVVSHTELQFTGIVFPKCVTAN
jgi:IS30 family transposase